MLPGAYGLRSLQQRWGSKKRVLYCHSVPSVSAKMVFCNIPSCGFYSLKNKTFSETSFSTKCFAFSTTKHNYISLLILKELGRDPEFPYWCLAFCRCLWKIWSAALIKNSYFPCDVMREKDLWAVS